MQKGTKSDIHKVFQEKPVVFKTKVIGFHDFSCTNMYISSFNIAYKGVPHWKIVYALL